MRKTTDAEIIEHLRGRCDALSWVATTLIQSHPNLGQVRASWHARRAVERAGGMSGQGFDYRQAYLEELAAWTMTLDTLAMRRGQE